jgi:hypothetical protein
LKTEKHQTLFLVAATTQERDSWRNKLASYSWAEGEFGMLCTDAAFLKFCTDTQANPSMPAKLKREAYRFGKLLLVGCYADVCLESRISGMP